MIVAAGTIGLCSAWLAGVLPDLSGRRRAAARFGGCALVALAIWVG
jgi:hypothetical protein